MKIYIKTLHIGFVFQMLNAFLFGARFDFPAGTPGRQENIDPLGQICPDTGYQNGKFCEHIVVPGTHCDLYFPVDGSQPDTADAGAWSGARHIGQPNDNEVTDWWVRVFGGNRAVNLSRVGLHDTLAAPQMGVYAARATHIIQVDNTGAPAKFEQQFWRTFRMIAADPVGRVLLYRLLIEIRRKDNADRDGRCGDDAILPPRYDLNDRNDCRSLDVLYSTEGFSFSLAGIIRTDFNPTIRTTVLSFINHKLATQENVRTSDIGLFHELLHWFHFLRNPNRFDKSSSAAPQIFKYPLRCYYGDVSELCTWGGEINAEEIATILGIPNLNIQQQLRNLIPTKAFYKEPVYEHVHYNQIMIHNEVQYIPQCEKFLKGDDLSENTYRLSRSQNGVHHYIRFGHGECINPNNDAHVIPDRFLLAYRIARDCYFQITNQQPQNWDLAQGQAIL